MQLVIKEIMDLSVRKNGVVLKNPVPVGTSQIPGEKSSVVKRGAKLSFSVDRLLKSPEQKQNNTQDKPVKDEIDSSSILPALSSACLTPPLPIRPLVSHPPPMPGSISLLQSLYVPTMYTHQVLVRPPELFGHPNPAAAYLPMHGHHPHHLNPMGNGKRKKSWTRAVFSHLQRKGLEKRFQIQKYITKPDRRQLAASLGLTDAQVKVWFQNRRMKWRHMESKERREKEKLAQESNTSKSIHPTGPNTNSNMTASSSTSSSSNSTAANFLNSNFVRPMQPESTTNLHLSRFSSFLPPVLPPHLTSTTSATSTFYDEDSDDDDDDEDDDQDDNPRLVMNADSTGDPEIKVD